MELIVRNASDALESLTVSRSVRISYINLNERATREHDVLGIFIVGSEREATEDISKSSEKTKIISNPVIAHLLSDYSRCKTDT